MKSRTRFRILQFVAATGLALPAGIATGQSQTISLGQVSSNLIDQSVWGVSDSIPEQSFALRINERSGGRAGGINTSRIPYICYPCGRFLTSTCCRYVTVKNGFVVDVEEAGIAFAVEGSAAAEGGTFDLSTTFAPMLIIPPPAPPTHFQSISGMPGFVGGSLQAMSPQPRANIDLTLDTSIDLDVEFAALSSRTTKLPVFDLDISATVPLARLTPTSVSLLGTTQSLPFGQAVTFDIPPSGAQSGMVCTGLGTARVYPLNSTPINGSFNTAEGRFRASGSVPIVDLSADLDALAFCQLGIPNPGGQLAASSDWGSLTYDRIDIDWNPSIALAQEFAFEPDVDVMLQFTSPVTVQRADGTIDAVSQLVAPISEIPPIALRGNDQSVAVSVFTRTSGTFSNLTALELGAPLQFDIDKAAVATAFGLRDVTLGPLISKTVNLASVASRASGLKIDIPSFKLADTSFKVVGPWSTTPVQFTLEAEPVYAVFDATDRSLDYDWTQFNRWEMPDGSPFNAFPTLGTNVTVQGIVPGSRRVYINGDTVEARNVDVIDTSLSVRFGGILNVAGTVDGSISSTDSTIEANFDTSFAGHMTLFSNLADTGGLLAATDDGPTSIRLEEGFFLDVQDSNVGKVAGDPSTVTLINEGSGILFSGTGSSRITADTFVNGAASVIDVFNNGTIDARDGRNEGVITVRSSVFNESPSLTIRNARFDVSPSGLLGEYRAENGTSLNLRNADLGSTFVTIDNGSSLTLSNNSRLDDAQVEITQNSSASIDGSRMGDVAVDATSVITIEAGGSVDGTLSLAGTLALVGGGAEVRELELGEDDAMITVLENGMKTVGAHPSIIGGDNDEWLVGGTWIIGETGSFRTPELVIDTGFVSQGRVNAADVTIRGPGEFGWFEPSLMENRGTLRLEGKLFRAGQLEQPDAADIDDPIFEQGSFVNRGELIIEGGRFRAGNDEQALQSFAYPFEQSGGSLTLRGADMEVGDFTAGIDGAPTIITIDNGKITSDGDVFLGEGADVRYVLSADSVGPTSVPFEAGGNLEASCAMTITLEPGYVPSLGDEYILLATAPNLDDDTARADFRSFTAPELLGNIRFDLETTEKEVILTVVEDQYDIAITQVPDTAGVEANVFAIVTPRPTTPQPPSNPTLFLEYAVNEGDVTTIQFANMNGLYVATVPPFACEDFIEYRAYLSDTNGRLDFQPAHGFVGVTLAECLDRCSGDVDGDGGTDTADITLVVSNLGAGAPGAQGTPGDADSDGETDTADITFVVSNLGCTSD